MVDPRRIVIAGLAMASVLGVTAAHAFDPAVPTAEDVFTARGGPVVLGRFEVAKAEPAIFVVEESLRGDVAPGRYAVFETGRVSMDGPPAVFAMSAPGRDFPPGRAMLGVVEVDRVNQRLTVPMATVWRFRVVKDRVDDALGFSTRLEPLALALRHGGAMPAWVPVKR
jgi:hypothetical protein